MWLQEYWPNYNCKVKLAFLIEPVYISVANSAGGVAFGREQHSPDWVSCESEFTKKYFISVTSLLIAAGRLVIQKIIKNWNHRKRGLNSVLYNNFSIWNRNSSDGKLLTVQPIFKELHVLTIWCHSWETDIFVMSVSNISSHMIWLVTHTFPPACFIET